MARNEPGPTVLRLRLGRELRRIREDAEVTRAAAARYIGLGAPTMSKIELGRQNIGVGNVRSLCYLYKVDEAKAEELAERARQANRRDWWSSYGDTVPEWFRTYIGLEADADQIWSYESEFVPGLMQTEEYTAAVRKAFWPEATEEDAQRSAWLRRDRQQHLSGENSPQFHLILNETVLHRPVGGPAVMQAQLDHLVAEAKQEHITLQVLPFSAGAHPGMNGAFSILRLEDDEELTTVYVEIEAGALYPDRRIDVQRYRLVFDRLADTALDERKSLALIAKVAKQM